MGMKHSVLCVMVSCSAVQCIAVQCSVVWDSPLTFCTYLPSIMSAYLFSRALLGILQGHNKIEENRM